jgi:hypothetical protein
MDVDSINIASRETRTPVFAKPNWSGTVSTKAKSSSGVRAGTMKQGPSERRVRIPVRLVESKWEFLFGGQVPVWEGAIAELVVNRGSIDDQTFLQKMDWRETHKVLNERTPLLVELNVHADRPLPENFKKHLIYYDNVKWEIALDSVNPSSCFVMVWLDAANDKQKSSLHTNSGGLWLVTHGFDAIGLASTTVRLPDGVVPNPVDSLNHAYTRLSELYEPWRISHTGNIYKHVLYQEKNSKWYPLDLLRNRVLVEKEHEIAQALWSAFLAKMSGAGSP